MKISYGITVCNEVLELQHLLEFFSPIIGIEDEIIVVYDKNRVTVEVKEVLEQYKKEIRAFAFDFQQNFWKIKII